MTRRISFSNPMFRLVCLLMVATLVTGTGIADDRDLVNESGEVPYLFVIFDVSGSMNWTPPDLDNGLPEDRWAPGSGDDPNSKFYQAKSALFQVMQDPALEGIHWGFATYNQDQVRAYRKHYLYSPVEDPPWATDLPYPLPGTPKHFGDTCMDDSDADSGCDLDADLGEVAWNVGRSAWAMGTCGAPQDLADLESTGELVSFPVLGPYGSAETIEWVGSQGREFEVTWHHVDSGAYGDDDIVVEVSVRERDGCGSYGMSWNNVDLEFTKTYPTDNNGRDLPGGSETLIWQGDDFTDGAGNPAGFYDPDDTQATNTCRGWEANSDAGNDVAAGVNVKYPTTSDPLSRHTWAFDRGDVIPFDWQDEAVWGAENSNRVQILKRLAPSFDFADPATADFRVAPYFQDLPDSFTATGAQGRLALKPEYALTPPLLPSGSTPIGNSMYNFMQWFDQWKTVATGPVGDDQFGCRTVNLLILSDGDETCYNGGIDGTTDGGGDRNPCWMADRLLTQNNRSIRTFIIGFGVPGTNANFLNCIAERGGTDAIDLDNDGVTDVEGPILPGNEQELVDAMKQIVNAVKSQSRSFASAAVPQAQVNVDDKVYLTSFMPLQGEAIWPGRLDAYLRPVPLREQDVVLPDGTIVTRLVPDPTQECAAGDESQCHIWNAAEELLLQAADDTQIIDMGSGVGDGTFNLGDGELQRRVYYSIDRNNFQVPDRRSFFRLNAGNSDDLWRDMLYGMDICHRDDPDCTLTQDNRDIASENMNFTHGVKTAEDPTDPGTYFDYILGDFFHSDPLVYGNPDNFAYWVGDAEGSGALPLQDPCDTSPDGYRCYFAKHRYRRKVIIAGTNDGQAHIFDAGFFRGPNGNPTGLCESNPVTNQEFVVGEFDKGTGRELFSYIPRTVMPMMEDLRIDKSQEFSVDGRIARGDAFIDPVQGDGIPNPSEREWRSTLVGTLREGGSGLWAIDITQPDVLLECDGLTQIPQARNGALDYVPSCTNGGIDCGTARYPEVMWEFEDSKDCVNSIDDPYLDYPGIEEDSRAKRCDDDGNFLADLGDTWSRPTIARIRVDSDAEGGIVDKYVAVFGGGMDPERKHWPNQSEVRGNFLFMVDMETGRAIYKRAVIGSAAGDPAVVDTDQDGYADTVYFGTTAGYLYKADISSVEILEDLGNAGGFKVTSENWEPFAIFNTFDRPIYHEPTVVFVTELGKYALAFGTGDREDLWDQEYLGEARNEGRFYMFVDRDFGRNDGFLPQDETDYQQIVVTDTNTTADYLRQAPYGWYLRLDPTERVISEAFSLAGITIFSSYLPEESISDDGSVCQRFGDSRIYLVTSTAANTLLSTNERYFTVEQGFLSPPFAETSQTKNPPDGDEGPGDLPDDMVNVVNEIKKLLPTNCKYANYTINIKAVRDDTGIEFLAAIPICTVEANWKDF